MTWPFENDTNFFVKKIAKADLKSHKMKTVLLSIIIILSTFLMAVVFIVFLNDALDRANSSAYHAMYQAVSPETIAILETEPQFDKVGFYKYFGSSTTESGRANYAYMDKMVMDATGCHILGGTFPQKENEVLVSKQYLKISGQSHQIGDMITLSYIDSLTHRPVTRDFNICGLIENAEQEKAKQYDFLFSDAYRLSVIQENADVETSHFTDQRPDTLDVVVCLNTASSSMTAEETLELLKAIGTSAGVSDYNVILNYDYIEGVNFEPTQIFLFASFALLLMFASSFAIYSIFYISVTDSIHTFAQLKSLGTTGTQLKAFLRVQGNILAIRCIPVGMLLALFIGMLLSSGTWILEDMVIALASGLLIKCVISLSLQKPSKILAKISPIEAMKYVEARDQKYHKTLHKITPKSLAENSLRVNKKKNRMSIISLSISGTLIIAMALFIGSINLKTMMLQTYPLNENFMIGVSLDNFYERLPQIAKDNPFTDDLLREVTHIAGVEKVIKDESIIVRVKAPILTDSDGEPMREVINSISPELIENVGEIVDGNVDYTTLGTDGVILNQFRIDRSNVPMDFSVGDKITFEINTGDGVTEKEFSVKGIAYFQDVGLFYVSPDTIHEVSSYNWTTHISVFCAHDNERAVQNSLQELVNRNTNLTLKVYLDDFSMIENWMNAIMGSVYGVCLFLFLFGILNMVNILITSMIVRKQEFALLQAVGMSGKQLRSMLYQEGLGISLKSLLVSVILGVVCGYGLSYLGRDILSFKFISFHFSVFPVLLFGLLMIGLQMAISYSICKTIEKKTLTERLRSE